MSTCLSCLQACVTGAAPTAAAYPALHPAAHLLAGPPRTKHSHLHRQGWQPRQRHSGTRTLEHPVLRRTKQDQQQQLVCRSTSHRLACRVSSLQPWAAHHLKLSTQVTTWRACQHRHGGSLPLQCHSPLLPQQDQQVSHHSTNSSSKHTMTRGQQVLWCTHLLQHPVEEPPTRRLPHGSTSPLLFSQLDTTATTTSSSSSQQLQQHMSPAPAQKSCFSGPSS